MKNNLAWFLALLLFFVATEAGLSQTPDLIRMAPDDWQLHLADERACAAAKNTCTWVSPESAQFAELAAPFLWLRKEVVLPAGLRSAPQLALSVAELPTPFEVFVNGQRIGGIGDMSKNRGPWCSNANFLFPAALAQDGSILITIRESVFFGNLLTNSQPLLLGTPAAVHAASADDALEEFAAQWQHYLCFFIVFCIGAFFLFLYGFDRQSSEYLWLGLSLVILGMKRFLELAARVPMGLPDSAAFAAYNLLDVAVYYPLVAFPFALVRKPIWKSFLILLAFPVTELLTLLFLLPTSLVTFAWLASIYHCTVLIGPVAAAAAVLTPFAYLVPLPLCFRSPLWEMRWIGGALLFLFFEDLNRFLQELDQYHVVHVRSFPQVITIGSLVFDVRAFAYLLFALVMLVTMTVRFRRMQSRNLLMEVDLEAARTVQQILIPEEIPIIPGLTIESAYLPANEVGGDFFQILPLPNGSTLILLGDVSGHGLPAAMTVSLIVGAIRTLAEITHSPAEMLTSLNRRLYGRSTGFATCLALALSAEGTLTYANAGHLNPYLDGVELQTEPNLPLGILSDAVYTEAAIRLLPDQHLTLLTDGVLEATDPHTKALFGFDRTREISTKSAHHIARTAREFGQSDDITVLSLTLA